MKRSAPISRQERESVAVVPGVLLAATHAKNDIPSEVLALRREFPQTKVHYGAALQMHPLVLKLMRERIIRDRGEIPAAA